MLVVIQWRSTVTRIVYNADYYDKFELVSVKAAFILYLFRSVFLFALTLKTNEDKRLMASINIGKRSESVY